MSGKIMIVDDDKEFLEELDFIVDDFDNGEDALNSIFEKRQRTGRKVVDYLCNIRFTIGKKRKYFFA